MHIYVCVYRKATKVLRETQGWNTGKGDGVFSGVIFSCGDLNSRREGVGSHATTSCSSPHAVQCWPEDQGSCPTPVSTSEQLLQWPQMENSLRAEHPRAGPPLRSAPPAAASEASKGASRLWHRLLPTARPLGRDPAPPSQK